MGHPEAISAGADTRTTPCEEIAREARLTDSLAVLPANLEALEL